MAYNLSPMQQAELERDDLGPTTLAIVLAFEVAALLVLFMRFYSRVMVTRAMGRDDWTIAVAMVFSIGMGVCQVMQVQWGSGKHQPLVTPLQVQMQTQYQYWSIIMYGVAITLTKLSILLLYRRIFHASKRLMLAVWLVGIFVVCFGIALVFSGLFTCVPANGFWNVSVKARCVNQFALFEANAAINIGTDFTIASLPLYDMWKLSFPVHQKIGVSFIFAVGWFVCAVSILRLYSLIQFARNFSDATYYGAMTAWWSCIEVNTAIMTACTPPLRALISEKWEHLRSMNSIRSVRSFRFGSQATQATQNTDRTRVATTNDVADELNLTPRTMEEGRFPIQMAEASVVNPMDVPFGGPEGWGIEDERIAWNRTPRLNPVIPKRVGILKSVSSKDSMSGN